MSTTLDGTTDRIADDPAATTERYRVSVEQFTAFRRDGFLLVPGLVPPEQIEELRRHTDDLVQGRLPEQQPGWQSPTGQGLEAPPPHLSPAEKAQHFLRIHMLHRKLELHERYLLHPRVLDVMEVLIGPDVLALQTMLFLKPPGKPGQGWHQDSFYIPTHPDTLCGAWIAIDDCDELNGAMWMARGSGIEPVYPPRSGYGYGDRLIDRIPHVAGVSDTDDAKNDLSRVAARYDQVLVSARAGDVVFFNGHVLHRSKQNWSKDRFRRSFVSHYGNARSFTQWGFDDKGPNPKDPVTGIANGSHILARGDTHLPYAKPRFGTPCAALLNPEQRRHESLAAMRMIADMNNGLMGCGIADPTIEHDHKDEAKKDGGY
jgi:ectoine hydroxylase-related dioxygenase (phytanoyl-CoA dioxygenase family)